VDQDETQAHQLALSASKTNPDALASVATRAWNEGQREEAIRMFDEALRLNQTAAVRMDSQWEAEIQQILAKIKATSN
jgi:hypothetical protein